MIAVLSNEWNAFQAWAWVDRVPVNSSQEAGEAFMKTIQGVILTVEAAHLQGRRRLFINADYSEFSIMDKKAGKLLNHFITNNKE